MSPTPEQAARRTCPLCKGIGASVEVDALHPDGRVENPQPAVCMVCEGEGTVGADANAPTPERAMILSAYYDQTTALCDLVYGTEGDAPNGAAEFHVELNDALADAYENGKGDLVERLNAERINRAKSEAMATALRKERDDMSEELQDLRSSRPVNVPALAARLQSVREMARDAATTAMARAIEDIIYDMLPRPTGTEGLIEK